MVEESAFVVAPVFSDAPPTDYSDADITSYISSPEPTFVDAPSPEDAPCGCFVDEDLAEVIEEDALESIHSDQIVVAAPAKLDAPDAIGSKRKTRRGSNPKARNRMRRYFSQLQQAISADDFVDTFTQSILTVESGDADAPLCADAPLADGTVEVLCEKDRSTLSVAPAEADAPPTDEKLFDDLLDFEGLLRYHGFGPASNMRFHWPPIPFQEAIRTIHAACRYCGKSFSKRAVLVMAEDYIQYNYLSKSNPCLKLPGTELSISMTSSTSELNSITPEAVLPSVVAQQLAHPGKCIEGSV